MKAQHVAKVTERRSISELAALYQLEPEIRDVFVEGRHDRALFAWYLRHRTVRNVAVREIDVIDVPSGLVVDQQLDIGARGRILTLAFHLSRKLNQQSRKCPTFVVDADFDYATDQDGKGGLVLVTDFACTEAYLFSEHVIDKLVSVALMGSHVPATTILKELEPVLRRLFLIRLANHASGMQLSWVDFTRNCKVSGSVIHFDEVGFIERYARSDRKTMQRISSFVGGVAAQLSGDARRFMNGHDFLELLRWYLRHIVQERRPLDVEHTFVRCVFACVEAATLDSFPLFQTLIQRVNG